MKWKNRICFLFEIYFLVVVEFDLFGFNGLSMRRLIIYTLMIVDNVIEVYIEVIRELVLGKKKCIVGVEI